MSHYLATSNPTAAARIGHEHDPLPGIGTPVLYYPRPNDVRQGRTAVPATVLAVDQDNRTLDLLVTYGANDQIDQQRVPERPGDNERGWSLLPSQGDAGSSGGGEGSALRADLEALRAQIWGDNEPEDGNMAEALMSAAGDITKIEARLAKLEKRRAKGKPGRPKGSKNLKIVPGPTFPDAA